MINTIEEEIIDLNETAEQITARLKAEYPTLRTGNEKDGYQELDSDSYNQKISDWVNVHLSKIQNKKAELARAEARAAAEAKLAAIGLTVDDLKALGLG